MNRSHQKFLFAVLLIVFVLITIPLESSGQQASKINKMFEKMEWRNIGPAVMGGRVVDIDVVEKQPWIIYAAIGPSGVWKSVNNGFTWDPVFEKENSVSVGDVTIAQSHPNIVWVGTGEHTCRNSVTIGDGVYKSENSGKTWKHMGLKNTRHISRIIINPGDPNIVYIAAMGHLWGTNDERGIYKTMDGGKTWEKILYVNEKTGFADLVMDPSNSLTLYASAYEHRRFPYYFYSGGPGSGLYKTTDGGKTWTKLSKDLPEGTLGRIGIAVSRSKPNVVYALIENKDGGIWRSEDRGETWKRTCDNKTYKHVNFRPFYYSQIRVDPSDDKVIYVFSGGSYISRDMGKKFRSISGGTHPDHHALWIDPTNPLHLIDGNDGGIDITYDGGRSWYPVQNLVLAEVYQIGFDMRDPYHVYCGLQDNGLWGGPSATYDARGITNADWYMVGGGDGFYVQVDPADHNTIYGNSQVNGLYRHDLRTRLGKTIRPLASLKDRPYRYNWNSPILISPHDPGTVYTGGNFLFRTINRGVSWEIISPDLTTDDPKKQEDSGGPITPDNSGAEAHCTIITIAESHVSPGVIWCGTDDGNVQITRDGGSIWKNVVKNIKGLPANTWCSRIEASHFDAGTAYAAFDGHRTDDYNTYVYKTSDYGKNWKSIKGNLPFGWIHVIREDLRNKDLLYVGTEFGIFASLDAGKSWFSIRNNLPTTAVRDIAVHPMKNDLIIGTHGRGIWILDNIGPLQEMSSEVLEKDLHFFEVRPVTQYFPSSKYEVFGNPGFMGKNPMYGITFYAYFKIKPPEIPKIFIKDQKDEQIFELRLKKKEGLQKGYWTLQFSPKTKDGKVIKSSGVGLVAAPYVLAGTYKAEMKVGDESIVKTVVVEPDPRVEINEKHRAKQTELVVRTMATQKKMGLSVTAVSSIRRKFDKIKNSVKEKEDLSEEVNNAIQKFEEKFKILEKDIRPTGFMSLNSLEDTLRGGKVSTRLLMLGMSLGGFPFEPTETDLSQFQELSDHVEVLVQRLNGFMKEEIPLLNKVLKDAGLKTLRAPKQVKL